MPETCPECGASVPGGGTCRDNFHALLLLESEIPGDPGAVPHFYAVASYGLQHPDSMNYTADALADLRAKVANLLDGRTTLSGIRRHAGRRFDGPTRIIRRAADAAVAWHRGAWPMTVADVCVGGGEGYADRVDRWARSVRETLDAALGKS